MTWLVVWAWFSIDYEMYHRLVVYLHCWLTEIKTQYKRSCTALLHHSEIRYRAEKPLVLFNTTWGFLVYWFGKLLRILLKTSWYFEHEKVQNIMKKCKTKLWILIFFSLSLQAWYPTKTPAVTKAHRINTQRTFIHTHIQDKFIRPFSRFDCLFLLHLVENFSLISTANLDLRLALKAVAVGVL